MLTKLYVGNLPFDVDDAGLQALLTPFGTVEEARVITNARNHSRGFGFATMDCDVPEKLIAALDGHLVADRPLQVRPAHAPPSFQRTPRPFDRDNRRSGRPRD